jgi:hypothetical protein
MRRNGWLGWLLALIVMASMNAATRAPAGGAERNWPEVFATMPLSSSAPLGRSNAIRLLLESFVSNSVIHVLVVTPGMVDDFHLIHRDVALPPVSARNLRDAIVALTNVTAMRATAVGTLLVIHAGNEKPLADVGVEPDAAKAAAGLQVRRGLGPVRWMDVPWKRVQPELRKRLNVGIRPTAGSEEGAHFERLNLAVMGATDWEVVEAVALATGSRAIVERRRIHFARGTAPGPQPGKGR